MNYRYLESRHYTGPERAVSGRMPDNPSRERRGKPTAMAPVKTLTHCRHCEYNEIMKMPVRRLIACALLIAAGNAAAENYEVGQIWSYKTRAQEPYSTLMILRIDNTSELGPVIFIGLKEVRVKHPSGKVFPSMSPLPFRKEALDRSVTQLLGKADKLMPSDFGYMKWKEAQRAGKTPPTYAKPVADIIDGLEHGYIGIPR